MRSEPDASAKPVLAEPPRLVLRGAVIVLLPAPAPPANAGTGIYHAGVEWKWWLGPGEGSGAFELQWGEGGIVDTPVIRCDEASWRFLGLSFAGWNAAGSALL